MGDETVRGMHDKMALFLSNPVTVDDGRLPTAYAHFQANLQDMLAAARDAGAQALVCTVGSNLKDWPPFASMHRPQLTSEALSRWEVLFDAGMAAQDEERWADAITRFEEAAAIDDRYAELRYRMGQCFLGMADLAQAGQHFRAAMMLDTLRIRADENINRVIREVAEATSQQGVRLIDAERVFTDAAEAGGIPGDEFFFDHVHMTFKGNHLLASTVLGGVEAALGLERSDGDAEPGESDVAAALAFTPWDRRWTAAAMEVMKRFYTRVEFDPNEMVVTPRSEAEETWRIYQTVIARAPEDPLARERFAEFLQEQFAWTQADQQLEVLTRAAPQWWSWHLQRAQCQLNMGQLPDAARAYQKAAKLHPYDEDVWMTLASVLRSMGKEESAIECLERAVAVNRATPVPQMELAELCMVHGSYRKAQRAYRAAVRLAPRKPKVLSRLAWFYATVPDLKLRDGAAAVELAEQACELSGYADADLVTVLAEAYSTAGRPDEAGAAADKVAAMLRPGSRPDLLARIEQAVKPKEAGAVSP